MARQARIVDVDCYLLALTEKAIKVTTKEPDERKGEADGVWLPLSFCEYETIGMMTVRVTLPEWKAIDTGLV